jgi:ferric-dicitrate binding protein FerR (iron transport regulator)
MISAERERIPSLDELRRGQAFYRRVIAPARVVVGLGFGFGVVALWLVAIGPTWRRARATMIGDFVGRTGFRSAFATWGRQTDVVLPDGSTVSLAGVSWLRYPKRWEAVERSVSLVGEAAFTIDDNGGTFIVQARDISVRAANAAVFTVAAPGDSRRRAVAVTQGIVVVWGEGTSGVGADTVRPGRPWTLHDNDMGTSGERVVGWQDLVRAKCTVRKCT